MTRYFLQPTYKDFMATLLCALYIYIYIYTRPTIRVSTLEFYVTPPNCVQISFSNRPNCDYTKSVIFDFVTFLCKVSYTEDSKVGSIQFSVSVSVARHHPLHKGREESPSNTGEAGARYNGPTAPVRAVRRLSSSPVSRPRRSVSL